VTKEEVKVERTRPLEREESGGAEDEEDGGAVVAAEVGGEEEVGRRVEEGAVEVGEERTAEVCSEVVDAGARLVEGAVWEADVLKVTMNRCEMTKWQRTHSELEESTLLEGAAENVSEAEESGVDKEAARDEEDESSEGEEEAIEDSDCLR
jgi:hemerythrin-like domain-containing protein